MQDIESIMFSNMSKFKRLNERRFNILMKKYDLRKIDMEIIIYLDNCKDADTASDIAATEMFTKGHISQSVKRLNENGYLNIMQDKKDLRVQHLKLSEAADEILKEMISERNEIEKCVFAGITDEEMDMLRSVFSRMCENIMQEINK